MADTPENPQAFPHGDPTNGGDLGMDLRDWFAGQALAGLVGNMRPDREQAINNHRAEADWESSLAYRIADAMLSTRLPQPRLGEVNQGRG